MKTKKVLNLCLIHQHPNILLGLKKRGFGEGRWNGFGGKLNKGETVEEAAKREVKEEIGVEVGQLDKRGIVEFEFQGNPEIMQVHIFKIIDFNGDPTEGEEMKPQWFHIDKIPFDKMWPDDKYWLPMFLENKKFRGKFLFGENDAVLDHSLSEVSEI